MKINVTQVPMSVADGTDQKMIEAIRLMHQVVEAQSEEKITQVMQTYLRSHGGDFVSAFKGLASYALYLKYSGSQAVVENLTNLLNAPNWEDAKDVVKQWRDIERSRWEVVPNV